MRELVVTIVGATFALVALVAGGARAAEHVRDRLRRRDDGSDHAGS